jgi:hypothetical protein
MNIKSFGNQGSIAGPLERLHKAKWMGSFDMRYLYFDYDSFHDHQVYFKKPKENQTRQMNA